MRIGTRIALSFLAIIIASLLVSSGLFLFLSSRSAQQQVSDVSLQTLAAIQTNVELTLDNANNYSKMIFSNSNLQALLRRGSIYSDLTRQSAVSAYLYNLIQAVPIIESVYVFDTAGNTYSVAKVAAPAMLVPVEQADWYTEVVERKGANLFRLNGGGILDTQPNEENFVSLVRLVRDLENTDPLGVMMLNIPESALLSAYEAVIDTPQAKVWVLDADGQDIVRVQNGDDTALVDSAWENVADARQSGQRATGYFTERSAGESRLVSYLYDPGYGITYVSVMPLYAGPGDNWALVLTGLVLLLANGALFFIGSVYVSQTVTRPVRQLLGAIQTSQSGELQTVETGSRVEEFKVLFEGYNRLIHRIRELIQRVKDEQEAYRQAELYALQVQIKPHFLYNTLDSVLSLNLAGQHDKASELVEALAEYYQTSVSKGEEVITIGQEVEMVRNYLLIQKTRYPDLFEASFELDEGCAGLPVLKLLLQPLAENALYHGLRPAGRRGHIQIGARRRENDVVLWVQDDGAGIPASHLQDLLDPRKEHGPNSFGLWGTLQRVHIFYGNDDCYSITSEPGKGTRVELYIPREADHG